LKGGEHSSERNDQISKSFLNESSIQDCDMILAHSN